MDAVHSGGDEVGDLVDGVGHAGLPQGGGVVPVPGQDAAALLPEAWGHRLVLGAKARLREYGPETVLQEVLAAVPSPERGNFRP